MWNLLGLFVSFSLIVFLVRKGKSFGSSMLLGAVVLAIFSQGHLTIQRILSVLGDALISVDTLALTAGVTLMGILAYAMKETGEIGAIIGSLKTKISGGGILASIPAIFGLLPIPGGALMSAPLIDEEGKRIGVSMPARTFLNLWFRHIIFLIFPLASPLLLLSHEASVALHWLILIQIPIFLVALLVGTFIIWKETRKANPSKEGDSKRPADPSSSLLTNIFPLFVSVLLFFFLSYLSPLSHYSSLVVSIPVGIAVSFLMGQIPSRGVYRTIKEGVSVNLALAVFGIMIFYKVIQSSGLAGTLSGIFLESFFPLPVLITIISFFLGFVMGHNLGAVGISYSILAPTISGSLPMISLVYISSFLGYLISPIHLCVVVSNNFFNSNLSDLYKLYIPPTLVVLIVSVVFMTALAA